MNRENLFVTMENYKNINGMQFNVVTKGNKGTSGYMALFSLYTKEKDGVLVTPFSFSSGSNTSSGTLYCSSVDIRIDPNVKIDDLIEGFEFIANELRAQKEARLNL